MRVLQARGFVVPEDVQDRLNAEVDVTRLDAILAAAVRVGPDLSGLFPD